jgi:hypothetical protein
VQPLRAQWHATARMDKPAFIGYDEFQLATAVRNSPRTIRIAPTFLGLTRTNGGRGEPNRKCRRFPAGGIFYTCEEEGGGERPCAAVAR